MLTKLGYVPVGAEGATRRSVGKRGHWRSAAGDGSKCRPDPDWDGTGHRRPRGPGIFGSSVSGSIEQANQIGSELNV
jgi:hypothetical protein